MIRVYRCPFCNTHLNPNEDSIVLFGECAHGDGLFIFDSQPGNYEFRCPVDIEISAGDRWEFFCPICRHDLTSEANENLVMLEMYEENNKKHNVFFSKIAREQCTYVVNSEGVDVFGINAETYRMLMWNRFI